MQTKRAAFVGTVTLLLAGMLLFWPSFAQGNGGSEIRLAGFVDVPGASLTLPLAPGSPPVTVILSLGTPPISISFTITVETAVEVEDGGLPVTIVDGDRVEIRGQIVGGTLFANEVEVQEFPEVKLIGTAGGLTSPVMLPLTGAPVNFTLNLGVTGLAPLPVQITSATQVEGGAFTLSNGIPIEIEGVVQDALIRITEIELVD